MVLECCRSIARFLRRIIRGRERRQFFADVPDHVIVEILRRLPSQSVSQCRKVCKEWRKLTSSSHFIELHQRNDVEPLTLLQVGNRLTIFTLDEKSSWQCRVKGPKEIGSCPHFSSCNGLVLLTDSHKYYVVSHLFSAHGGRIAVIKKDIYPECSPCGFFFHPLAKEYRILSYTKRDETHFDYVLYLFGAKEWRRPIGSDFHHGVSVIEPAIVNGVLHWNKGSRITTFDMVTEEFSVKSLPFADATHYSMLQASVKDNGLCVSGLDKGKLVVDVWTLDDYANWSWSKTHVVDLHIVAACEKGPLLWCLEQDLPYVDENRLTIHVISIHRDRAKLLWHDKGVFSYHLRYNTCTKIPPITAKEAAPSDILRYGAYKP